MGLLGGDSSSSAEQTVQTVSDQGVAVKGKGAASGSGKAKVQSGNRNKIFAANSADYSNSRIQSGGVTTGNTAGNVTVTTNSDAAVLGSLNTLAGLSSKFSDTLGNLSTAKAASEDNQTSALTSLIGSAFSRTSDIAASNQSGGATNVSKFLLWAGAGLGIIILAAIFVFGSHKSK